MRILQEHTGTMHARPGKNLTINLLSPCNGKKAKKKEPEHLAHSFKNKMKNYKRYKQNLVPKTNHHK